MRHVAVWFVVACTVLVVGCELGTSLGATVDRPGIPEPESYEGAVEPKSEEMLIGTATTAEMSFRPVVTQAFDSGGFSIYGSVDNLAPGRVDLMLDGDLVNAPLLPNAATGVPLGAPPVLEFVRYWVLIEGPTPYAGGVTQSFTESTTIGSSNTFTYSFTETVSETVEVELSLFAGVSGSETFTFAASQEFTQTTDTSYTESYTFAVSPQPDKRVVYTVWQLYEEMRFVDDAGGLYDHPSYEFTEESLRVIVPTDEIVPVTTYFDNE
jgi:hypothetical protein